VEIRQFLDPPIQGPKLSGDSHFLFIEGEIVANAADVPIQPGHHLQPLFQAGLGGAKKLHQVLHRLLQQRHLVVSDRQPLPTDIVGEEDTDWEELTPVAAAQLKFEVEDKLRRYYSRPGQRLEYVFTLEHQSRMPDDDMVTGGEYPTIAGYAFLVRKIGAAGPPAGDGGWDETRQYLERIVAECIDAEFRAYQTLPEIRQEGLANWFIPGGPAYLEIVNLLVRHQRKGWVIANPLNPSTKRLMSVQVVRQKNPDEQLVKTSEYWYLKWYDSSSDSYAYVYRETNRQMYVLRPHEGTWKVYQNIRPSPRTSIPMRWNRKQR
jgi:hypothetical protein